MSFLILTQFPGLAVGNCRRACVSPGCCLGIFQPVGTFGCCKDTSFSVHFQAWSRFCGIGRCIFWFPEGRRRHSRGCPYSVPAPDLYRSLPSYRPVCHAFRAASVSRYLVFPDFPTCWEIFLNLLGNIFQRVEKYFSTCWEFAADGITGIGSHPVRAVAKPLSRPLRQCCHP